MARLPSIFGPGLLQQNVLTTALAGYGIIPPLWGIFNQDGESVVEADNVATFEFRQDWTIADYPMEEGAFESYDKVDSPFSARVTFTSGGSFSNRQALIDSLDAIAGDLKLYDVVTPEKTYLSCNIDHIDYRRTAVNGSHMIQANVWLKEIRENAVAETAESKEPAGSTTVDGGQVQAKSPQNESIISAAFSAPTGTTVTP